MRIKHLRLLFFSAAPSQKSKLAVDGGEKAVKQSPIPQPRWGDVEQKQLGEMLQQSSLFYWNGPQTKLLMDRWYALESSGGHG